MAIKVSLEEALKDINEEIPKILSKDFREVLDKRITILDLSYKALKVNVYRNTAQHIKAFNYAYGILVDILNKKATRQYKSLEDLPSGYFDKPNAPFVYINGGDSNRFLVASSFGAIRTFVTKQISEDPNLKKTSFGQSILYKEKVNNKGQKTGDYSKSTRSRIDIGHIASEDSENLVSPLELKISEVLQLGTRLANPIIIKEAELALKTLYAIQADASYTFKNTTPEAIALAQNKLGNMYVVVTLHREKLNRAFSKKELGIFNRLKANIALKISKFDITSVAGSNTILEDLEEHLINTIKGNNRRLKTHKSHTVKKPKVISTGKLSSTSNVVLIKKPKEIRSLDSNTISLLQLQNLLNRYLFDAMAANMGDGDSRNVLNYRTGRLAASAKVERLTSSREGLITAFYSYQKNPYATFSAGGRQQYPKTRDPKLLISKSIRDIAAEYVTNQLRSVNI